MSRAGLFLVVEGIDGSGKSTQADLLATALGAVLTREPGGTPLGRELRSLLLHGESGSISDRTEALLMAADRAEHVHRVIAPTLASGRDIVSDRHTGSSVAYQGYGRGLDVATVRDVSAWATDGLVPDAVVLVDVPVEVAMERRVAEAPDRIESAGAEMQERVRQGFLAEAAAHPGQWIVVDGRGAVEEVAEAVRQRLSDSLGDRIEGRFT
jgi:dTMP kinase